jgi:hypothetical protein
MVIRSGAPAISMSQRVCTECGKDLSGRKPGTKTCSPTCRSVRSRRVKRERGLAYQRREMPEHQRQITEIVRQEVPDVAHEILKEEMRPIVREALTEDVLRAINRLVSLAPAAIEGMAEDLLSEDPIVRQRAYTLVAKYTIGHPAIVRPADTEPGKQLVVHFNLPRPGVESGVDPSVEGEAEELTDCDMCGKPKTKAELVANSTRCQTCWDGQREEARVRYGVEV